MPRTRSTLGSDAGAAYLGKVCPTCLGRYPVDFRVCPRDATELEDADDEEDHLIGATLNDTFQIIRVIGEGGMGRVYEARHVRLPNKRFAIKMLLPAYAQQSMVVARFQREAEAASGIGHPNVVDVYDVGRTPDGLPYLVSEYLDGKDFASLLEERGKIDAPSAVRVVRQVCRALAAAHAKGVVHRDVKPENVFLVGDPDAPVAKVLDFGISKVDGGSGASLTRTGMIMGTPGYIPPEQARGAKADHRADIYGVGAMLYRAVTGKLPFDSDDPGEALSMVLTQEAPQPRSVEPSIPVALELVIQKAMAKDPAERHQSMMELDEELAAFAPDGRPSLTGVPAAHATLASQATRKTVQSSSHVDVARVTKEARMARPTLVLLSVSAYLWATGCLVDGLATAFAWVAHGGEPPTGTERMVVAMTIVAASVTPAIFWFRHLRSVWHNTVRSVAAAQNLRQIMLAATIPYAAVVLVARVAGQGAVPQLPVISAGVSLGAAAIAHGLSRRAAERRKAHTALARKA